MKSAVVQQIPFPGVTGIGQVEPVPDHLIPSEFHELLVHDRHMTLVLEAHHDDQMVVDVLEEARDGSRYQREVLLRRSSDGVIAQYALLRVDLDRLPVKIVDGILDGCLPFGRLLRDHAASSRVRRLGTYEVKLGDEMCKLLDLPAGVTTFGRRIVIEVSGVVVSDAMEILMPNPATRD